MNNNSFVNLKKAKLQDSNFFLILYNKNKKNTISNKLINRKNHFAWFKKKL